MGRKKKDNVILFKRVPKALLQELKEYVETKVRSFHINRINL